MRHAYRWGINKLLTAIEQRPGRIPRPLPHPPVFILGPPRCGSTLLYQLIVSAFDVGYLSNRHCYHYGHPGLVEARRRRSGQGPEALFTSRYGRTEGRWAPSECAMYWYRFFPRSPHVVPAAAMPAAKKNAFRRSGGRLVESAGAPVFFKNLYCAGRLDTIIEVFPESLFVVVDRPLVEVAHSLLEARKRVYGSYEPWFSFEPPGHERMRDLPPGPQVVEQAKAVYALIRARLRDHPERVLHVDYEDLCADVEKGLVAIADWLQGHGAPVERRGEVPVSFPIRQEIRIDRSIYDQACAHAEVLEGRG